MKQTRYEQGAQDFFAIDEGVRRRTGLEEVAERKLAMLEAAADLGDLRSAHPNYLQALRSERKGRYAIHIDDSYRIEFHWGQKALPTASWMEMRPVHPGEILREEFLDPKELSANQFASLIRVPANRISEILGERRSVTADTALRLGRALKTTAAFWLNLQAVHDLRKAEIAARHDLDRIVPLA